MMSRYAKCPQCGKRMKREMEYGVWTGNYWCDCESDEETIDEETISVEEAALIWASHGKDEDYTFGYTEEELEDAL